MACDGTLLVADRYDPGWRVWIDRSEGRILDAAGMRGVSLSAGVHRIEFRYRPAAFFRGLALTAIGLACAAVLVLREASPAILMMAQAEQES